MDIRGQREDSRALSISYEDKIVYIIFAGELYELDLAELYNSLAGFISLNIEKIRSYQSHKNID